MKLKWQLVVLHFFVGLGALVGGIPAILDPANPMGMPDDALQNGPFQSFLIPGLFLSLVLGCANLLAGIITIREGSYAHYANMLMGLILCLWIIIQCYVLWDIVFVHVVYLIIGFIQLLLGYLRWKANRSGA
ncbi:hypothetical protein SAMN04488134_107149 [Amphibacillus marinus]|uniref:Uncharacterized protein n=1 Tax=Amphibacillus marinus TaxID=872970 RepID=A0A1H8PQ20_9BACI|nr:hypothetical protein [Amphibacillus marinus]SEO44139.1 hypothetical protein SAMN04488134_107149 [Amphibacillus marinus]